MGREQERIRGRLWLVAVAALAALLALGAASPAVAKKKKKKKAAPAVTMTAAAPLSSASSASATANCTGKNHLSGGGYVVSPHLDLAVPNTGLRSVNSTSTPVGVTAWNARPDAFSSPSASGSVTAIARCESNSLSQIATVVSGSATIPTGQLTDMVITCPPGTHVVSAGYAGTGLGSYVNNFASFRIIILGSHRTALNEWTIEAFESSANPASGSVSVAALCEKDAKGRSIGEVSTIAGFATNSRASGDPTCPAKQHVVSGGYLLSPIPQGPGAVPVVGIDEFEPSGNSTWHLGLHTVGPQPPGSSVATYAYCAKDTVKKKKKKK